ncbi:WD40 repeat domain-containing protein [Streptomyces sp. NPDC057137]|uniref:WD40 repeat domain-containing protein n=1 Tax=Streptomyces sp. NPDC057137 TaxID=3346030 RepID=UPI0036425561
MTGLQAALWGLLGSGVVEALDLSAPMHPAGLHGRWRRPWHSKADRPAMLVAIGVRLLAGCGLAAALGTSGDLNSETAALAAGIVTPLIVAKLFQPIPLDDDNWAAGEPLRRPSAKVTPCQQARGPMPRPDSRVAQPTRALAAEQLPATAEERLAERLGPASAPRSSPQRAVLQQPRLPLQKPRPTVGWFSRSPTPFAVAVACLTAIVAQEVLPVPWSHKGPEKEVKIEQWRLVENGRLQTDLGADALAFSPENSHLLLTISAKALDSWDVTEPEHPERVTPGGHGVKNRAPLGITPDGQTLVVADGRHVLGLRTDTGQRVWSTTKPHNKVKAIHASRYGVMLALSDASRFTQLKTAFPGDADGVQPAAKGQIPLGAHAAQFSPDGRTLAIAISDGTLHLWDISSGEPRCVSPPFAVESGRTTALAFSADGRLLAAVGADHVARLWDVENPKRPRPLGSPLASNTPVTALAFSRDPRIVATVGIDRTAYLWRRN